MNSRAAEAPTGARADVAVVVITRDRVATLLGTLANLVAAADGERIVVVDNGSCDGTDDAVRRAFPSVELIRSRRNLGAAGRNLGADAVDRPFIAFCDDDTRWDPSAIERAADHLRHCPDVAVVAGAYVLDGGRPDPLAGELAASPLGTTPGHPGPDVLGFQAGATMVRRNAFLAAGGFHPRSGVGGEEALLAIDLVDAGWHVCHAPDVQILHEPARRSPRAGRRRARHVARNHLRLAVLRRSRRDVVRAVLDALRRPRTGWSAVAGVLADAPWLRRERRVVTPRPSQRCAGWRWRAQGSPASGPARLRWSIARGRVQRGSTVPEVTMAEDDERRLAAAYHGREVAGMVADRLVEDVGVERSAVRVDRTADRALLRAVAPPSASGATSSPPRLPMAAWVWFPAGFVVGFVVLFLLGVVVADGEQPRLAMAIIMGGIGGVAGGVIGAIFGRARGDLASGSGRPPDSSSVLTVRTGAIADRARVLEVLADAPVASMWEVDRGRGAPQRLHVPTVDRGGGP